MKRTIRKLLIILAALFISVGSTVAYLTDVDKEVNIMTLDRVEIDLIEQERTTSGALTNFQDNHPLYPGYYPQGLNIFDEDGYWVGVHNTVDKIVTVKNTGKAPAYVRLWFAFEITGDVGFFDEKIHLNRNATDWQWVFLKNTDGSYAVLKQNGTYYVVATATYSKVLPANSTAPVSLRQVLLDSSATNDDFIKLGDKYSILVVAQGMQSAGFDSSWEAINEGFGVPSLMTNPFAGMMEDVSSDDTDDEPIAPVGIIGIIVNTTVVDFREKPDVNSASLEVLHSNATVEVLQIPEAFDSNHWYKIRYNSKVGYVQAPYVYVPALENADTPGISSPITDFDWDKTSDGKGIVINNYVGKDANVVIPSTINGLPVVKLTDYLFAPDWNENTQLKSVTIPDSVTKLSSSSFSMCPALESITVNSNNPQYLSIGGALYSKDLKTLVKCPEGYVGGLVIPEGVTKLESDALNYCTKLTAITIPSSITKLDRLMYGYIENLSTIKIASENPTYIAIDNVVFTKDMTELVWFPSDRSGTYTVPEGILTIGSDAFQYAKLDTVNLPQSLLCIEDHAFSHCEKLANITIPENVHTIGYSSFLSCESLKSFYIPANVTRIDMEFVGGRNLTNLQIAADNPSYTAIDSVMYTKDMKSLLWCPLGKTGTLTIPEGVETIKAHAVEGCWELSGVILPDSLQVIEPWAFSSCNSLTNIHIPKGVSLIWCDAFAFCESLNTIQVSTDSQHYTSVNGVLFTKDMKTLLSCPGGKQGSYAIPDGVTKIIEYAFAGCTELTDIHIPDSVTTIEFSAFEECRSLKTVIIPNRITNLPYGVFWNCFSLESVTVPPSVTSIDDGTFAETPLSTLTVYCEQESATHKFCDKNNIKYKFITF